MEAAATSARAPTSRRRRARGITLLESVVAVVVLASSTVAVSHLQAALHLASDLARERTLAVRLGEEAIDAMRAYAVVEADPERRSFAAIASGSSAIEAPGGADAHAVYRVEKQVEADATGAKHVAVTVRWNDRDGAARDVSLRTLVARSDPAYAGALALGAGTVAGATRGVGGRAPFIPVVAHDLGDGRSVYKPVARGRAAFVYDNASGNVVGRCDDIAASTETHSLASADLTACTRGRWLPVSGTVRFALHAIAAAHEVPLATTIAIDLRDGADASPPRCYSEARKTVRYVDDEGLRIVDVAIDATLASAALPAWTETGDRFVAWQCLVTPRAEGRWSGRIAVVAAGWTIGIGSDDRRVCRYRHGAGDAIDANIRNPGELDDVSHALGGENFVVVPGGEGCPRDPPTEPHQP